ncbi:MAG: hypothetical protein VKJ24_20510 [Synechococcales bacterium]|nr:hypothetical protein [Synechococcales bacterium]
MVKFSFHFCSKQLPTKQTEKPIALALTNNSEKPIALTLTNNSQRIDRPNTPPYLPSRTY